MDVNNLGENRVILADIGARGGIPSRWHAFKDKIHFILCDADPSAEVISNNDVDLNYSVIPLAFGRKTGEIKLNICKGSDMSSTYEPNYSILAPFEKTERFTIVEQIMVPVSTLDNQLQNKGLCRIPQ